MLKTSIPALGYFGYWQIPKETSSGSCGQIQQLASLFFQTNRCPGGRDKLGLDSTVPVYWSVWNLSKRLDHQPERSIRRTIKASYSPEGSTDRGICLSEFGRQAPEPRSSPLPR